MASSNIIIEQIINKILNTQDISFITDKGLTEEFFPGYEDEFYFLIDHYEQYKKVPDKLTFADEFEDFNFFEVEEPDEYLYKQLYELRYSNYIYDAWEDIVTPEFESNPVECMEKFKEKLETAPQYLITQGTDIISTAQERFKVLQDKVSKKDGFFIKTGFDELDAVIDGWSKGEEFAVIFGRTGQGKEQPLSSKILTPSGWKLMGDIKKGDNVYSQTGNECQVIDIFPQGKKSVYKICFDDGTSARCGLEHLWKVRKEGDRHYFNKTLNQLINSKSDYYIPLTLPIRGAVENHSYFVYIQAVMMMRGFITNRKVYIRFREDNYDNQLKYYFKKELLKLEEIGIKFRLVYDSNNLYQVYDKDSKLSFLQFLDTLDMLENGDIRKTYDKLLLSRKELRIMFLRGVMDCQGENLPDNTVYINPKDLKEQTIFIESLLRSLGCYCIRNGNRIEQIRSNFDIFNIPIKSKEFIITKELLEKKIMSIIPDGEEECQCIMVNDPTHTYITDNYIVTHNTWIMLKTLVTACKTGNRVGFISPEMSAIKIGYRFDSLNKGFSNRALNNTKISENPEEVERYKKYLKELSESEDKFIVASLMDFNKRVTVSKLRTFCKNNKLDILGIDGISYLRDERSRRGDNRSTMLMNISEDLMSLSNELQIPIVIAVQSNRGGVKAADEEGTPDIDNIRDSDGISFNATKILSIRQVEDRIDIGIKKYRDGKNNNEVISYYWDPDKGVFDFYSTNNETESSYREKKSDKPNRNLSKENSERYKKKRESRNSKVREF